MAVPNGHAVPHAIASRPLIVAQGRVRVRLYFFFDLVPLLMLGIRSLSPSLQKPMNGSPQKFCVMSLSMHNPWMPQTRPP